MSSEGARPSILIMIAVDLARFDAGTIHVDALARSFVDRGHRTTVLAPRPVGPLAIDPHAGRYRLIVAGAARRLPRGLRALSLVPALVLALWSGRAEVVYVRVSTFSSPHTLIARLLSRAVVVTEHNGWLSDELLALELPSVLARISGRSQRLDARLSHVIRVVVPGLKDRLVAQGIEPGRIVVIGNGTDLDRMHPTGREAALAELGLDPSPTWLGFIGNLAPWQGVHVAVEAMRLLREDGDVRLIVAGEGPQLHRLRTMAVELGVDDAVVFLGAVPLERSNAVINAFDIALIPATRARNEAIGCSPLKLRDYAAAGRPVVAADLPGLRELAGDWLVTHEPDDPASLAAAVRVLLGSPDRRGAMAVAARRHAEEHLSWERVGDGIEAAIAAQTTPSRRRWRIFLARRRGSRNDSSEG